MSDTARLPVPEGAQRLKGEVLHAIRWAGGILLLSRLLVLVRAVGIARILGPGEFGRFAAAMLAIGIVDTLSQPGFRAALIQRPEIDHRALHTAWTWQLMRGIVLSLGMLTAAPLIGTIFHDAAIASLVQVLAVCSVISGASNIATVFFERELRFDRQFLLAVAGSVMDVAVSVAVVLVTRSAWALVAGALAGCAVRCAASYSLHSFRPRWTFDLEATRSLFRFGRWMSASGMLIFLIDHLDDVSAGILLGPASLGLYQMAYRIMNLPATEVAGMLSDVAFPVYSRALRVPDMLQAAFRRFTSGLLAVAVPLVGFLVVLLGPLTGVMLGPAWTPMVPAGRILALFVVLRLFGSSVGSLYLAIGRPDYVTKLAILQITLLAGALAWFVPRLGLTGIAWAVVLPMAVTQGAGIVLASRVGRIELRELAWHVIHPLIPSALAAGAAAAILTLPSQVQVIGGAAALYWIVYTIVFEILGRRFGGASLRRLLSDLIRWKARTEPA